MINKKSKIFVAGHKGMVGRAIMKKLSSRNLNVITVDKTDLDLTNQSAVQKFLSKHKPKIYRDFT